MRIEVSFTRLDPPQGQATRVSRRDGRHAVDGRAFVGWLGLLGVLQLLTDDKGEPPPP